MAEVDLSYSVLYALRGLSQVGREVTLILLCFLIKYYNSSIQTKLCSYQSSSTILHLSVACNCHVQPLVFEVNDQPAYAIWLEDHCVTVLVKQDSLLRTNSVKIETIKVNGTAAQYHHRDGAVETLV